MSQRRSGGGIIGKSRGPYRVRAERKTDVPNRPSVVLAKNIGAYRALRHITQDDLAARMTALGHDMSRSAVSAIEGLGRSVSVDEMFGLAISLGVTIGQLFDPTGPDHGRVLPVDLGLTDEAGAPWPVSPWLGHLLASSHASVRLPADEGETIEIVPADEPPLSAQRELRKWSPD